MKKLFIILGLACAMLIPMQLKANESEETIVCYYKKNCEGELIYVCEDSNLIEPQESFCPSPCNRPKG